MVQVSLDRQFVKKSVFIETAIATAILFGFAFSAFVRGGSVNSIILLTVSAILWLALVTLHPFVLERRAATLASIALQAVAIWLFLTGKLSFFSLAALVVLVLFLAIGAQRARRELDNTIRVKFFRIAHTAAGAGIAALASFAALYLLGAVSTENFFISRGAFQSLVGSTEVVVEPLVPGYSATAPFGVVLESYVTTQLPTDVSSAEVSRATDEFRILLERKLGGRIRLAESFSNVLYDFTAGWYFGLPKQYRVAALIALGIIFYTFAKSIAVMLIWFAAGVGFLVYQALIGSGFFKVTSESVDRDVLTVR